MGEWHTYLDHGLSFEHHKDGCPGYGCPIWFEEQESDAPFTVDKNFELTWIGVDLDRTLAKSVWPLEGIGEPIEKNLVQLRRVVELFPEYEIHIFTARPWSDFKLVKHWLRLHDAPFHAIVCGKPLYRFMFDDIAINAYDEDWVARMQEVEAAARES